MLTGCPMLCACPAGTGCRGKKKAAKEDDSAQDRIAVVNPEKCKPKKCNFECKKGCPVVRMGKQCIEVSFLGFAHPRRPGPVAKSRVGNGVP